MIGVGARGPDRERDRRLLRLAASSRSRPASAIIVPVMVASIVLGLVGPPLAALPAIRRGARLTVREGLEEVPALEGGPGCVDRRSAPARLPAAHGADRCPQRHPPHAPQPRHRRPDRACGRDVARRAGARSTASRRRPNEVWNELHYDLDLNTVVGKQLDAKADPLIRTTPGVAVAQPMLDEQVKFRGQGRLAVGVPATAAVRTEVAAGRWFTAGEETGHALAWPSSRRTSPARPGRTSATPSRSRPRRARPSSGSSAMTSTPVEQRPHFYVPLQTLQAILHSPDTVNGYFVQTRAATTLRSTGPRHGSRTGSPPTATPSGR